MAKRVATKACIVWGIVKRETGDVIGADFTRRKARQLARYAKAPSRVEQFLVTPLKRKAKP